MVQIIKWNSEVSQIVITAYCVLKSPSERQLLYPQYEFAKGEMPWFSFHYVTAMSSTSTDKSSPKN